MNKDDNKILWMKYDDTILNRYTNSYLFRFALRIKYTGIAIQLEFGMDIIFLAVREKYAYDEMYSKNLLYFESEFHSLLDKVMSKVKK